MRLTSSGKIEIALEGRRISGVIRIMKLFRQHHPQHVQENPDSWIFSANTDEWVLIRRSTSLRKEEGSIYEYQGK
jgi:hypothetical protein